MRTSALLALPALVIAAALVAVSCTTAPVTGRRELDLVPEDQMNQLGLQTYQQTLAQAKTVTDPKVLQPVQDVSKRIADAAEKEWHPGYQWDVKVIDDPKTVNAWCLPGGKMAVYSGLLPVTQDENGLAVVMGHETAHALAHHGAERLSRSQIMQMGLSGLLAAVNAKQPSATQAVGAALGLGSQLGVELPFSREQESEADHIGLILMAKAGFDPTTAIPFWQRMQKAAGGKAPPEFLSDHPSDESRIANLQKWMPEAQKAFVKH